MIGPLTQTSRRGSTSSESSSHEDPALDDCVREPIMDPVLDDCVREPITGHEAELRRMMILPAMDPCIDDCVREPIMDPCIDDCVREPIMDPCIDVCERAARDGPSA